MFRTSWKDGILTVVSVCSHERVVALKAGAHCVIQKFPDGIVTRKLRFPSAFTEIILLRKGGLKTLYVKRCLKNCDELIEWAKGCGFKSTLPPSEMHVTIAHSRTPVDWDKLDHHYGNDDLVVPHGVRSQRTLKNFGGGATVLAFTAKALSKRWMQLCKNGCSWDYPEYEPHVTLTYNKGDMDIDVLDPYGGPLQFGPEVHAEIDEDWKDGIVEQGVDGKGFFSIRPFHV